MKVSELIKKLQEIKDKEQEVIIIVSHIGSGDFELTEEKNYIALRD